MGDGDGGEGYYSDDGLFHEYPYLIWLWACFC
jgi:hypothetical protein